jgi:hypothetical protein
MSKISIQINQLLVDSQKYLLQKIATEYKLDYQELLSKFLEEGKQSEHTVLAPDPALPDVRIVAKKPAVKKTKVPDNKKKSTRPVVNTVGKCVARVWGTGFPQCTRKCKEIKQDDKTCDRFCKTHFKFWLQGGDGNLPHGIICKEVAVEEEKSFEPVVNPVQDLEKSIVEELDNKEFDTTPDAQNGAKKVAPPAPKKRGLPKKASKPKEVAINSPELVLEPVMVDVEDPKEKQGEIPIDDEEEKTPIDEEEEEEVACKEFEYDGDIYLLDPKSNKLYKRTGDNEFVGKLVNGAIDFDAEDSDAESDDEED